MTERPAPPARRRSGAAEHLAASAAHHAPPPARPWPTRLALVCAVVSTCAVVAGVLVVLAWFRPIPGQAIPEGSSATFLRGRAFVSGRKPPARPTFSQHQARVFFTTDGASLRAQIIDLPRRLPPPEMVRFVVEELLRGPATDFFVSVVPDGVELRGAYVTGDQAVVDLTGEGLSRRLGGPMAELLCVNAIVSSITQSVEEIDSVRILIDGKRVDSLWGEVDLTNALVTDASLIQY